nr:hypothetical protein [Tanacetum cinerariifolium]
RYSDYEIAVLWDVQNVQPADALTDTQMVFNALRRLLPCIKIHIKAYGDYAQMSKESRDGILTAGADLLDVCGPPGQAPGQSDTDRSLLALRDLGYFTILVYKELSALPAILKVVRH